MVTLDATICRSSRVPGLQPATRDTSLKASPTSFSLLAPYSLYGVNLSVVAWMAVLSPSIMLEGTIQAVADLGALVMR